MGFPIPAEGQSLREIITEACRRNSIGKTALVKDPSCEAHLREEGVLHLLVACLVIKSDVTFLIPRKAAATAKNVLFFTKNKTQKTVFGSY